PDWRPGIRRGRELAAPRRGVIDRRPEMAAVIDRRPEVVNGGTLDDACRRSDRGTSCETPPGREQNHDHEGEGAGAGEVGSEAGAAIRSLRDVRRAPGGDDAVLGS